MQRLNPQIFEILHFKYFEVSSRDVLYLISKIFLCPFGNCLILVSYQNLDNFILFNVELKCCNYPSVSCASTSNTISRHIGVINERTVPITDLYNIDILLSKLKKLQKF
jgi:hypothetical protein